MTPDGNTDPIFNRQDTEEIDVWFRRNGERVIDKIVDNNLDLRTKIGKEIKKAVNILMQQLETEKKYKIYKPDSVIKDKSGREYVAFDDLDFQEKLMLFEVNPNSYGGVLYLVEVFGDYYVGLTERSLKERFKEHVINSMRGYVLAEEGIEHPNYPKFHRAIAEAMVTLNYNIKGLLNEMDYYSATGQFDVRDGWIYGIIDNIKPFIQSHIIEFHYGTKKLGNREKLFTQRLPFKNLVEKGILNGNAILFSTRAVSTDYLDLKKNGLNTKYGGGGSGYAALPMYDVAIMVALGFSAPKIARILHSDYKLYANLKEQDLQRIVQYRISDILGGSYRAQEELLSPLIEHLVGIKGITRHEIYQAFKHAESSGYGWFVDWSYGRAHLKADIDKICELFNLDPKKGWETIEPHLDSIERYYAGFSESQWLDWIFNSVPRRSVAGTTKDSIQALAKIGERKIKNIIKILAEKHNVDDKDGLMYKLHRERSLELIKQGYIEYYDTAKPNLLVKKKLFRENFYKLIYTKIFNFKSDLDALRYFEENLFDGLSVNEIWDREYLGDRILS